MYAQVNPRVQPASIYLTHEVTSCIIHFILQQIPFAGLIQTLLSKNTSYRLPRVLPLLCEVRQLLPCQVPLIDEPRVYMIYFYFHVMHIQRPTLHSLQDTRKTVSVVKQFRTKAWLRQSATVKVSFLKDSSMFFNNQSTKSLFSKRYINRQNTRTSFSVSPLAHTANNLSSSRVALNLPVSEADADVHERNCAQRELCFLFELYLHITFAFFFPLRDSKAPNFPFEWRFH